MGIIKKLKKHWNWGRITNNIKFLIKHDLEHEKYSLKDETIEDCVYEFEELKERLAKLKVLNERESIKILSDSPKSYARYGDGEINIMCGTDTAFQEYDTELARKMKEILIKKRDNLYVGLNSSYFQSPTKYSPRHRKFYRLNGTRYRRFFNEICDPDNVYLDACCFGGYFRHGSYFNIDEHMENIRNLFRDKDVCVVCGEGILDKLEHDVFELARKKTYVFAPKINAFSSYEVLLDKIVNTVSKDTLVCIILGMTATVLAADLADKGYIAWDFGHAAKGYDAYKRKLDKTDAVIAKFFAPD